MAHINNTSKWLHRLVLIPVYSLLVFRFVLVPGFHSLHCSLVGCAEASGKLTFKDELPQITLRLPDELHESAPVEPVSFDLDKLAKAVARHETCSCTCGNSAAVNNAFGIREWINGKPRFKHYASCEESYKDFKRIWSKYYGRFPDAKLASRYSGNDRPYQWLANVTKFYNEL